MEATKHTRDKIQGAAILLVVFFAIGTPVHANVNIIPVSVNFGNQTIGIPSAPVNMTLTNARRRKTTIVSISSSAPQFSYSWPSLPFTLNPGQQLTGAVAFTPAAPQTYKGTLTLTAANGQSVMVSLSGTGVQAQPSATVQPTSETVTAGQTASFSVSAWGVTPLGYQWKKNGTAINGATSVTYTTPPAMSSDNGAQFDVTVFTSNGSTSSNSATLTVNAAAVAPSITAQPASRTVTAGQTASFSVAATGTAPLSYKWMKGGAPIAGATSSTYTTPATITGDTGSQFSITVSNSAGNVTSTAATLTVSAAAVAPSITTQPVSRTVIAGQTASFSVAATGTAPLSYQWMKSGTSIAGATLAAYTTLVTTTADSGSQFSITVSNSAGNVTSTAATLTVNAAVVAPSITTQPVSRTVIAGQTASFSVAATGTAPLSYQWMKSGTPIAGATLATYTTPVTTTVDAGSQFSITVSNSAGSVTSNAATLTVTAAAVAPAITTEPASRTVIAGQTASFSVAATGTAPLNYQWMKGGTPIAGATSSSYTTPATTTADSGSQFSITVSNSAGNVTSNAATLTVTAAAVAPAITTQPASRTVIAGQTASFSIAATGTAPLNYQWMKGGTPIAGATSSSYTTPVTTIADNGLQFSITVSNSAGSVTSNAATLTINAVPGQLTASASTLGFGNVNIGTTSSQSVRFTNSGNANITISSVIFSGSGAGFNMSGLSNGLILGPGQTATLTVTFTPAATGSVTDSVTITSNAANSPASIGLSGTGLQPPISHSVTLSWTPSISTVIGYNTYRAGVSGGAYSKLNSSPVTTAQFIDSNVQSGQTYYYVVTSVASNNVESTYSNEVPATIP
jgi:hypothetical protein